MGDKRAVVLLSGGLDSATVLAMARDQGYDCYCLSFYYGQRHNRELQCAKYLAFHFKALEHRVVDVSALGDMGGSALTDPSLEVPAGDGSSEEIPITYVPARNIIFLSYGLAYAEIVKADAIFIGANAIDYSGYPDCRPEFFSAYQEMADKGTKTGVEGKPVQIMTPIIDMTKGQIIQKGLDLQVPYAMTWSCYKGGERACGVCDSCILRLKGFADTGSKDPVQYE
jgi:7-cyano-7-deazaguanine synthase